MESMCLPAPAQLYQQFYVPAIFEPLSRLLVDFAPPAVGATVLDVACGTGVVARRVAERIGNRGRVLAVDISADMLAVARSASTGVGARVEFVEADAVTSIYPIAHFDIAYCQQGLQFFADHAIVLRRIRLALKPRAPLAIAAWQGIEQQPLFAAFAEIEALHLGELGVSYNDIIAPFAFGGPAHICGLLEGAGFHGVRVQQADLHVVFDDPHTFTRRMEMAYAAVVPAFARNPARFEAFITAVERDTRDIVSRFTVGDQVRFTMRTNLAAGHAP